MTSAQAAAVGIALVGSMLMATPADAGSSATQTPPQSASRASSRSVPLVANGGFSGGTAGWIAAKPRRNALTVSRAGIDRSEAAVVTTRRKGTASLWNAPSNSAVALAAGDRVTVSAVVRSTQKKRAAFLAARARSGSGLVARQTKRVRLGNKRWHRVTTAFRVPRKATSLRIQVRVPGLKAGRRMLVDNVVAIRNAAGTSKGGGHSVRATTARTVISANFNSLPTGQLSPENFIKTIGGSNKNPAYLDDTSIAADSRGSGKVLRTRLAANTFHGSGGNNGIATFVKLDSPFTSGCISYQIRFSPGFDWDMGGKLPGLEGVRSGIAPSVPSGGTKPGDRGWSGRLMWVSPQSYAESISPNTAVSYMYNAKQKIQYGDNYFWSKAFVAGRWHTVKQCYTMNTVGQSNGVLRGWFDGSLIVNKTNFVYRTRNDVAITHLMWHIFRGGANSKWASSKEGYVDIDNLLVTES